MKIYLPLLFVFLLFQQTHFAQTFSPKESLSTLNPYIKVLTDEKDLWTIDSVASAGFAQKFDTSSQKLNFGFESPAKWVRFTLQSPVSETYWLELANIAVREARIFYFDSLQNRWEKTWTGDLQEYQYRSMTIPNHLLELPVSNQKRTFYLRIKAGMPQDLKLLLWKPNYFVGKQNQMNILLGIFFGSIILAFAYNLSLYYLLKDRNYLFYSLSLFFMLWAQSSVYGYSPLYLYPIEPMWLRYFLSLLPFPLTRLSELLFMRNFLKIRQISKPVYRLWQVYFGFVLFQLLLLVLGYNKVVIGFIFFFQVFSNPILLYFGWQARRTVGRVAIVFMLATSVHFLGTMILVAQNFGLFKMDFVDQQFFLLFVAASTYSLEIVLISTALAYLINNLKSEVQKKELEKIVVEKEQEIRMKLEKERIAKDLHDNIGSQLTSLSKNLEQMQNNSPDEKMQKASELTAGIIQELRNTIWVIDRQEEISVQELDNKIQNLLWQSVEPLENIVYEFKNNSPKHLIIKPLQALGLFRIVQEALQNSLKHSRCSRIGIDLGLESQTLKMQISDNGIGFEKKNKESGHYGLLNMQERAEEIGASFAIESVLQKGTTLKISLPI